MIGVRLSFIKSILIFSFGIPKERILHRMDTLLPNLKLKTISNGGFRLEGIELKKMMRLPVTISAKVIKTNITINKYTKWLRNFVLSVMLMMKVLLLWLSPLVAVVVGAPIWMLDRFLFRLILFTNLFRNVDLSVQIVVVELAFVRISQVYGEYLLVNCLPYRILLIILHNVTSNTLFIHRCNVIATIKCFLLFFFRRKLFLIYVLCRFHYIKCSSDHSLVYSIQRYVRRDWLISFLLWFITSLVFVVFIPFIVCRVN